MKYSETHLRDAKITSDNVEAIENNGSLYFSFSYDIIMNHKTKRWRCECQSGNYNKNKYCKHILGMLYKFDIEAYNKEIENDK